MSSPDEPRDLGEEAEALGRRALRMVCAEAPFLAGLAHRARVHATPRVRTAGVFASGRIAVNPRWFTALTLADATFVMAHELLHLLLRTHERAQGSDALVFNVAHDAVINDLLVEALGRSVPAQGIALPGARHVSPEYLLPQVTRHHGPHWGDEIVEEGQVTDTKDGYTSDALSREVEKTLFADDGDERLRDQTRAVSRAAWESIKVSLEPKAYPSSLIRDRFPDWSQIRTGALHRAARWMNPVRWDMALQQWLDGRMPGDRSYARPSRRGADRTDVVLAGRQHTGWMIHVLLDTSTSMSGQFEKVLGALRHFCDASSVDRIRIVQAGSGAVAEDRDITPDELERFRIHGTPDEEILAQPRPCTNCGARHGVQLSDAPDTNLAPAFEHLARDPSVRAVIAITDGYVDAPSSKPPFEVLWVLAGTNECFVPPWGAVIPLVPDRV